MTQVINTSNPNEPTENMGWVGMILLILVIFVLLYLGVPYFRSMSPINQTIQEINPAAPSGPTTAPEPADTQLIMPGEIDVNLNVTSQPGSQPTQAIQTTPAPTQ